MNVKKIYTCSDGRTRAYYTDDNGIHHVCSYPRILMEQKLGRPLEPYEDVHHIDGNRANNDIDNFELQIHGEHQRKHSQKYFDKEAICEVCGKPFVWTAKRQQRYYADIRRSKKRIISCSPSCSSFYGRQEQLGRNS